MPGFRSYISKIFDSVGKDDSDFSSFADGLNDVLASSLEGTGISFEDIEIDFNEIYDDLLEMNHITEDKEITIEIAF